MLIVTSEVIGGYEISETLGIVRGNSVRAKWFGADIVAGLKTLVGGELDQYSKLLTEAREVAVSKMVEDAEELGADAIVATRFTTSQIAQGAAEIMVFGTAVKLRKAGKKTAAKKTKK